MEKACPEHGLFRALLGMDWDGYRRISQIARKVTRPLRHGTKADKGCPHDCGLCPDHDQHTCLAILEVTTRCDLACPICLADSRPGGHDLPMAVAESALRALLEQEGGPTPLQLSGGEPTLHAELPAIVARAASLGFHKIEIDSNGLLLAGNPALAERLREAGLTGVYLQIDGLEPAVCKFIRGRDLIEEKIVCIENCRRAGLQVVLSVTVVPGINDHLLWEMVRFGLEQRITGVNFQPLTRSGRFPAHLAEKPERLTLSDFLTEIEKQSGGKLLAGDLRPIPCPDPRCGALSYLLIHGGNLIPLHRLVREEILTGLMADLSDWEKVIPQLGCGGSTCCGCAAAGPFPLAAADSSSFLPGADFFSLGFHGMMDAWNFDVQRVKRCCVHELTPQGKLIPFCLYNIKYRLRREGWPEVHSRSRKE